MKRFSPCLAVLALVFTTCAEFEPIQDAENEVVATPKTRAGAAVFEVLENPYELGRMRRIKGNNTLQPTHKYVRILPQDSTQLNKLEDVYELDLFDYPLALNIEDDEVYVDPTTPAGGFTWQYTVVPANFNFPSGYNYQVLQQCYIPADGEIIAVPVSTRASGYMHLEEAAILDCGYVVPVQTRAGDSVGFSVQNPLPGATYEWLCDSPDYTGWVYGASQGLSSVYLNPPAIPPGYNYSFRDSFAVECRAVMNGEGSAYSNRVRVLVDYSPRPDPPSWTQSVPVDSLAAKKKVLTDKKTAGE